MRRSNSTGNWIGYLNNNGMVFNQSDSLHPARIHFDVGAGGIWTGLGRFDTVVFGAGLWFGGLRMRSGVLTPHAEFEYDPNSATTNFVPGSIIYGGNRIDSSQSGRDKYRIYSSNDIGAPEWPLRIVNGRSAYIDNPALRAGAGPKYILGDEDMFYVCKESDPLAALSATTDPFFLEIRTQASFWNSGLLKDVVIFQNQIIYSGPDTVFDPVVALAVDGDINNPDGDRTKGLQDEAAQATVFFKDQNATDPLLGVMVLAAQHGSHRTDPGITSIRYWDIDDDPTTDSSQYAFLTEPHHDTALSVVGDARILLSSLSQTPLAPGDTIYFDYAMFVKPATGPALIPSDSATMLNTAAVILEHYLTNSLDDLSVVDEQNLQSSPIIAYPNPASDKLYLIDAAHRPIALYDELGRQVAEAAFDGNNAVFDVRRLAEGSYLVRSGSQSLKVQVLH